MEACFRAVGEEIVFEARRLAELEIAWSDTPILVSHFLSLNDIRASWISKRLERHHRQLESFAASDFTSSRWRGRRLRKRVSGLLRDAVELANFSAFLHQFDGDAVPGMYGDWAWRFARGTGVMVLLVTELDAAERLRLFGELEEMWAEIAPISQFLSTAVDSWTGPPLSHEEIVEETVGERPKASTMYGASFRRAFPGGDEHLVRLGYRQLRLIADTLDIPHGYEDNYLFVAVRLGTSNTPVFAHYTAVMVGELIWRAVLRDADSLGALLVDFNRQQAGRIQTAGMEYERLLASALDRCHSTDLPDAYRTLAEGIFRPYGSLLVRMHELATTGGPIPFTAFGTLGELQNALPAASRELGRLAQLCLNRELRNYEAHEDIVRTDTGSLAVVQDDGTVAQLDPDDVMSKIMLMRSFLDGVDAAVQVAFLGIAVHTHPFPTDFIKTEAFLESMARFAAGRLTDGRVDSLRVDEGRAIVEFSGTRSEHQLVLLMLGLRRIVDPTVSTICIKDSNGEVLLEQTWT